MPDPLISENYRRLQATLHHDPAYGVASLGFAPIVAALVNEHGFSELLDYGCGKRRLMQALEGKVQRDLKLQCYDPAIPEFSASPSPMEFVVCIDVLEHVEPGSLDAVLDDLQRCVKVLGFFSVHTGPAQKVLADGRNAHLVQKPADWWLPRLMQRFELQMFRKIDAGFVVIVSPLKR